MLKSLKLTNFKKHQSLQIDFKEGLNLIVGANYSGKSTILHGILFALFGPSAVPGGSALVTSRAGGNVKAELDFTDEFEIDYTVTRTKSQVRLYADGELVATSATAVANEIEHILGMSKRRFLQLRYGEQGDVKALMTLGAGELHNIVEEVGGVGLVNEVIDKAKVLRSQAIAVIGTLEDVDVASLAAEVEGSKMTLTEIAARYEGLSEEVSGKETLITVLDTDLQAANKTNAEAARWQSSFDAINAAVTEAEESHAKWEAELARKHWELSALDAPSGTIDKLEETLRGLRRDLSSLALATAARDSAKAAVVDATSIYKSAKKALADAPAVVSVDQMQEDYVNKAGEAARKIQEATALSQRMASGICPECGSTLDDSLDPKKEAAKLTALNSEASSLDDEAKELRAALKKVEKSNSATTILQAQFDSAKVALGAANGSLEVATCSLESITDGEDAEEVKSDVEQRIEHVGNQLKAEQMAEETYRQAKADVESVGSAFNDALARVKEKQQARLELGAKPDEIEVSDLAARLKAETDLLHDLKAERGALSATYKEKRVSYQYQVEKLTKAKKNAESLSVNTQKRDTASQLIKYLSDNRDRFMTQVWQQVMGYASGFSSNCTGGDIESVKRTSDGEFAYVEAGEEVPIAGASGAQKSIMSIGTQLAMAKLLRTGFDTVLLDEPAADMDMERSLALVTLLGSSGKQVLAVSHSELDSSSADNTIHIGG